MCTFHSIHNDIITLFFTFLGFAVIAAGDSACACDLVGPVLSALHIVHELVCLLRISELQQLESSLARLHKQQMLNESASKPHILSLTAYTWGTVSGVQVISPFTSIFAGSQ